MSQSPLSDALVWSPSLMEDFCVLSGVSEPVARAYAEELARHGVCIILVGPDHSALRDIATSLTQSYGVEVAVVQADSTACKPIKEVLRGTDIGFLVNCVVQPSSFQTLLETPEQDLLESVNKNIAFTTLMVRLVLPGMVERSRGAVVNISSGACCRPLPGRVTLAASTVASTHSIWTRHHSFLGLQSENFHCPKNSSSLFLCRFRATWISWRELFTWNTATEASLFKVWLLSR